MIDPKQTLAEKSVLQHILLDLSGDTFVELSPSLQDDMFLDYYHQAYWSAIKSASKGGGEVHVGSVLPHVSDDYVVAFNDFIDHALLMLPVELRTTWVGKQPWKASLEVLTNRLIARKSAQFAGKLKLCSEKPIETLNEITQGVEELKSSLHQENHTKTASVGLIETLQAMEEQAKAGPENIIGAITTGFKGVDEKMLGGPKKGNVIVIGGRPAMGKSCFTLDLLINPAIKQGKKGILFSLEMTEREVFQRMIAHQSGTPLSAIITGNKHVLESRQYQMMRAMGDCSTENILVNDNTEQTIESIDAEVVKHKPDYIIIDYFQLMTGDPNSFSREHQLGEISKKLKVMAKTRNIVIYVLSQLNREAVKRGSTKGSDGRPQLIDLRETGSLEQDANAIIFIHRPALIGKHDNERYTEIIIAKNRNGECGIVLGNFDGPTTRIFEREDF